MLKECYALEKVDGTSAHLHFEMNGQPPFDVASFSPELKYFSGGSKHENFLALFDHNDLMMKFSEMGHPKIVVYGEAYGGKLQGMSKTYGPDLKFIVFDVLIGDSWLSVPKAEAIAAKLGLEFVPYTKITTDLASVNAERDRDSEVAIRRGMGTCHIREGVVLHPIEELRQNNGKRIMCKHKRDEFRETKTPREVDPTKILKLKEAQAIASEYVVPQRLQHVLDKFPHAICIENTGELIQAMLEDIHREADEGTVFSPETDKAISRETALLFKKSLQQKLEEVAT